MNNLINKHEDYSGLITKAYDEIANDVNTVQAVIDKDCAEIDELNQVIDLCKISANSKSMVNLPVDNSSFEDPADQFHRIHLQAYLPNNQFTILEVRGDQTLSQSLEKKLSNRGLRFENLAVFSGTS
ncbi:hypothetical protein Ciccas_012996, partial [Cichlidogyrus casuarinus]